MKLRDLAPQCFPSEDPRQQGLRIVCNGVDDLTLHRPDEIRLGGKVAAKGANRDTRCTGNLVHANIWSVNSHGFGNGFQIERAIPYRVGPD